MGCREEEESSARRNRRNVSGGRNGRVDDSAVSTRSRDYVYCSCGRRFDAEQKSAKQVQIRNSDSRCQWCPVMEDAQRHANLNSGSESTITESNSRA